MNARLLETCAIIAVGVSAALFLWPYLGYPLFVRLVPRRGAPRIDPDSPRPRVSVLIPAHEEVQHIGAKLENTLAFDYPRDLLQIVVCSDGSTDGTDEVVETFRGDGVELIRNEERSGKAVAIDRLLEAAAGEVLLLTDASAELAPDALGRLVDVLSDPDFAVAGSRYVVNRKNDHGEAEAGYWSFEARLRAQEAARDLLVGASGAAYAVRASCIEPIAPDTVNDDWTIPLRVRMKGHRIGYVPEAVASDDPTPGSDGLYHRWVRIAYGNYQMLWRQRRAFLKGRLFWPLGRKLLRTLGPILIIAFLTALAFVPVGHILNPIATLCWALAGVGLVFALVPENTAFGRLRVIRFMRFAALSQVAYLRGFLRFIARRRRGIWRRPEGPDLSGPAPIPWSVRVFKRSLDILSAIFALLLLWPVMLAVGIAIRWESKGPVIYRQTRLCPGGDGNPAEFVMLKFRSMRTDAEADGPAWAKKDDDRVTRVGRFIRKHRIDELPQFVNVLRGEMSLVGPRPERGFYADQLQEQIPGYNDRHMVLRPGLTGWAQVNCEYSDSVEGTREKLTHDLVYVAHLYRLSDYLKMEFNVIRQTFRVVLTGKGAR